MMAEMTWSLTSLSVVSGQAHIQMGVDVQFFYEALTDRAMD